MRQSPGMPWAAKAGSASLQDAPCWYQRLPGQGMHRDQSASMSLDRAMAAVCCCTQAGCTVLQKGPVVHSSSSNAEKALSPSAITASTWGFHPQQGRDSCTQPAHFNTHLTCQQPAWKAPGDLSASPPYVTATSQQTISTVTEKSLISPFPSVFTFPQTCSAAISTKLHFRHYLGYRAIALFA